jgi:hypothetical protein
MVLWWTKQAARFSSSVAVVLTEWVGLKVQTQTASPREFQGKLNDPSGTGAHNLTKRWRRHEVARPKD